MKEIVVGLGVGVVGNALYQVIVSALQAASNSGVLNMMTKEVVERELRMRSAANALRSGVSADSIDAAALQIEALSLADQQRVLSRLLERIGA